MILEGKSAIVYGGSGTIGAEIAGAYARHGARVWIAGRSTEALDRTADQIRSSGGRVETDALDALDARAVDEHADRVAAEAGGIDVSFNAISHGDVHGTALMEMALEDFERPVLTALRARFLTFRAAARHMTARGTGVLMTITATTAKLAIPEVGGTAVAFDAIESLCRQYAAELGTRGIRVVWIRTTGLPEALADVPLFPAYGTGKTMSRDELVEWNEGKTMLRRLTTLRDVGEAAVFAASEGAGSMTGASINLSAGAVPG